MKNNELIIEENEFELLKKIINSPQKKTDNVYNQSVRRLEKELKSARILKNEEMPDNIVRINSNITVKIEPNLIRDFKIVFPEKSNISQNKLSILSPMGLALYGYCVNDEISWQFPSGINKLKILKVE
jgi:regulator of nucleoside diphosphate kinase